MYMNMNKKISSLLQIVLLAGVIFAWFTVYQDFSRFYNQEGTLFKVNDCVAPNPVATPCFYGAFAFLAAFIWSVKIPKMPEEKRVKQYKFLLYLIIASTLFAWSNFIYIFAKYVMSGKDGSSVGCSGQPMDNPFSTPCFIGSVIFLAALIVAFIARYKNSKEAAKTENNAL